MTENWYWASLALPSELVAKLDAKTIEALSDLDLRPIGKDRYRGLLPRVALRTLEAAGAAPKIEGVAEDPRVVHTWVSVTDRFSRPDAVAAYDPFAASVAPKYMNLREINSYLVNLSILFPRSCELMVLPHLSHEGRAALALRLGQPGLPGNQAADLRTVVVSGLHAREWGGPDILVFFADRSLKAYSRGADLVFGNYTLASDALRQAFQQTSLIIAPCINPDGVCFSHEYVPADSDDTVGILWRKNRSPAVAGQPNSRGVDLNRNFDFLHRFNLDRPSSPYYRGPHGGSEPETQNVVGLIDSLNAAQPATFIDVHNYGPLILHSWGNASNQSDDASSNYRERADPTACKPEPYAEFMEPATRQRIERRARQMAAATGEANGAFCYGVNQIYPAGGILQCACGTSTDFASSRMIEGRRTAPIDAFTIEFGQWYQHPYFAFLRNAQESCAAIATAAYMP